MTMPVFSLKITRKSAADAGTVRRGGSMRLFGMIMLALAGFLAWRSNWFQTEKDLSRYPEIRLAYTACKFERITHFKGSTTKQIVFITEKGRYVMEDGVWGGHFDGPVLAAMFSGGGTVRAWVHPEYSHALRGITGGKVDIPPQWGLEYDQRNARVGIWMDAVLALVGTFLCVWKRRRDPVFIRGK